MKLPNLSGNILSELLQLSVSQGKSWDLSTGPDTVTSTCAGSVFSFIVKPLEHEFGCRDIDLGTRSHVGGWGMLKGCMQVEETLLRKETRAEGDEGRKEDLGGLGTDGNVFFKDFIEKAQDWLCLVTTSLRVSIGDPLTDHSVIPIWRRWERAWLDRPLRFSKYSPQHSQPISFGGLPK